MSKLRLLDNQDRPMNFVFCHVKPFSLVLLHSVSVKKNLMSLVHYRNHKHEQALRQDLPQD